MNNLDRHGERGGARLKFLIVVIVLAVVAYCGYQYVPVAYQAYLFKDQMQQKVDAAAALGYTPSWVTEQLTKAGPDYNVPADAAIESIKQGGKMECHVQFNRPIEFPGYTYTYAFDHTAKSTDFMFKQ